VRLGRVLEDAHELRQRGEPAPARVRPAQGDEVLLVEVPTQVEPVEGAQGRGHATRAAGRLEAGAIAGQDGEAVARGRVVVVDERPVGLVRQVGEVGDAAPTADAVASELALAHGDPVLLAVQGLTGGVVDRRLGVRADAPQPTHVGVPVDAAAGPGDDQDAVDHRVAVRVPELHVLTDETRLDRPVRDGPLVRERVSRRVHDPVDLGSGCDFA